MDEDYARKLRAWLRAEPEALPRRTDEEREWLRDVPAPQPDPDRWTVRGQLPAAQPDTDEDELCPVIVLPVPRLSRENGCRMSDAEVRSRRNHPSALPPKQPAEPRAISEAEARSRWNHPSNWHRRRREETGREDGGR